MENGHILLGGTVIGLEVTLGIVDAPGTPQRSHQQPQGRQQQDGKG
jgi:hypothetical protein